MSLKRNVLRVKNDEILGSIDCNYIYYPTSIEIVKTLEEMMNYSTCVIKMKFTNNTDGLNKIHTSKILKHFIKNMYNFNNIT